MSQSNVIFASIFLAYIVFITMRGELPIYLGFLLKSAPAQPSQSNAGGGLPSWLSSASKVFGF